MDFDSFERLAHRLFREIPKRYRAGVDGLTVGRAALAHPRFADLFTLGECVTTPYPSNWDSPETTRSLVLLHWGSFRALAKVDPAFDWQEQIWETLTHELRHHLESLADRDDLAGVDYAMEQEFRRRNLQDFDPEYYRHGDRIFPGVYAVENSVYIEQWWQAADFAQASALVFSWGGRSFTLPRPTELGDVHFVVVVGDPFLPTQLDLVLVRRSSWLHRAKSLLFRAGLDVLESEAVAKPTSRTPDAL